MRTYILTKTLPVLGLVLASLSYAQTNTENYVQSKTCLNDDCTRVSEAITYFDGLGRAKQIVSVKSTPSGKDLVTPVTYDGFGRQVKDILPVPALLRGKQCLFGKRDRKLSPGPGPAAGCPGRALEDELRENPEAFL
jgi:hypothetical protein